MSSLHAQHPNIQNFPAFFSAMADALAGLHARGQAHGAIVQGVLQTWLTDGGDALDSERFIQAAKTPDQLPPNAMTEDIFSFAHYCIGIIVGASTSSTSGRPFQAAFYRGPQWPDEFLDDLEILSVPAPTTQISISKLSAALKASVTPPEIATHTAPPVTKTPFTVQKQQTPAFSFALRNGTVGKPYQIEPGKIAQVIASQRGENPNSASVTHLQLPDDCGLVFDVVTGSVSGIPTMAFDGELSLDYLPTRSGCSIPLKVKFLINPDPASLWKDLPPPTEAPYQKKLLDNSDEQHGRFRVVAASRRGRSHANKAEFRDDDYAIGYAPETQWLVVVVADGAGSATYSRRGSQIACHVAKSQLAGVLNSAQHNLAEALYAKHRDWQHPEVKLALRQILYEAALLAHHKLREEVDKPAEPLPAPPTLRNYDTTLILLAMKRTGEGCVAASFSIGDGGAGILPHAEEGLPLTQADGGEHAGQTTFLTFPDTVKNDEANLEKRYHQAVVPEFAGALVMTDGITDPKFPSDAAFADPGQWAALWAELQPVLNRSDALLEWMNFFSPGNHDDRTLVAILPA